MEFKAIVDYLRSREKGTWEKGREGRQERKAEKRRDLQVEKTFGDCGRKSNGMYRRV